MECKSLRESGAAVADRGVALFAASCDDVETNRKFAESLDLPYPVLSDPGGDIARAYGVLPDGGTYPRRWTFYIAEGGTIVGIDRDVDPRNAGEEVVRRLEELGLAGSAPAEVADPTEPRP